VPAMEQAIAAHCTAIVLMTQQGWDDFDAVVLTSERADLDLARAWATVGHLACVAETPALRDAHAQGQALMAPYLMEAGENREHYAAFERLSMWIGPLIAGSCQPQ